MEMVHVQKKIRQQTEMQNSETFWFLWTPRHPPVLLNPDLHPQPCRQIGIPSQAIWWRHPIPAVLSHASTSQPSLQDPKLLSLSSNWPEKELITLQLTLHYLCVDFFWPFYVYSQIGQMAGPAEQINIKFTLQLLLSGGNWWAASKLLVRKDRWA